MTAYFPAYRMTIYELDGVTVLTPSAAAPHAEAFRIATKAGVAGFRPYMNFPRGRRSRVDLLSRRADIGELTISAIDERLVAGGSNFERWLTAFVGDDAGQNMFLGKPVLIEEALDGSTWTPFMAGVVNDVRLGDARVKLEFVVRENGENLKAACFVGRPHPDVAAYADSSSLLPLGPPIDYGGWPAAPRIPATVKAWSLAGFGSGTYVLVRRAALVESGRTYTMLTTVMEPLAGLIQQEPLGKNAGADTPREHPHVQVDLYGADGGAYIGTYALSRMPLSVLTTTLLVFGTQVDGPDDTKSLRACGIAALPATDVRYAALPAAETDVEFRIMHNGPPTKDAPIYIESSSPALIAEDLLAGKFGRANADGDPLRVMPANAASFTARKADTTVPTARFRVDGPSRVNEFVEEQICRPFGLGYRFNTSGEVELVDVRMPTTSAGVDTITNDDLAAAMPGWSAGIEGMIAEYEIEYYVDSQDRPRLFASGGSLAQRKPTWIFERGGREDGLSYAGLIVDSPGFGRVEPYRIDARGLRYSEDVDDRAEHAGQRVKVGAYLRELGEQLRSLFSGGLAQTPLRCLRSSPAAAACMPLDIRIVDVDEIPNAASSRRGGARLARCVERTEEGPTLLLRFVDLGADAVAVAPTIGSPSLVSGREKEAIQATLTLNAAGEPAVLWVCPTPTSVGAIPAHDDPRWMFGARRTATGVATDSGLPSGSRIWVRARSAPTGKAMKLPSPWVTPSGTKFVDTTGLPAPTGLSIASQTGSEARIAFTPGAPAFATEMFVDGQRVDTLPPGSTRADFRGLAAGSRTLGLRHPDGRGGFSSLTTIGVTISGALEQAPDMVGIGIAVGEVV